MVATVSANCRMNLTDQVREQNSLACKTVTVTTLAAGQPRPYADSFYEAIIEFDFPDNPQMRFNPRRETVEQVARLLVHDWVEPDEDGTIGWWQPRLEAFEQQTKGRWYVKVRVPYDD